MNPSDTRQFPASYVVGAILFAFAALFELSGQFTGAVTSSALTAGAGYAVCVVVCLAGILWPTVMTPRGADEAPGFFDHLTAICFAAILGVSFARFTEGVATKSEVFVGVGAAIMLVMYVTRILWRLWRDGAARAR
jgi:hypothetical protein